MFNEIHSFLQAFCAARARAAISEGSISELPRTITYRQYQSKENSEFSRDWAGLFGRPERTVFDGSAGRAREAPVIERPFRFLVERRRNKHAGGQLISDWNCANGSCVVNHSVQERLTVKENARDHTQRFYDCAPMRSDSAPTVAALGA
jgi:hypothetical protein